VKPRLKIATAETTDGTVLELFEHDGAHEISIGGAALMGTRQHHSEEELARLACEGLPDRPVVMIGGLGIGFTLRAALDLLPEDGQAIQVELLEQIVQWNRGPLAHHAGRPLEDPRTRLVIGDVAEEVLKHRGQLAAIMLDVDNGATPMVMTRNSRLYGRAGLRALKGALVPGGALAIWSANDDPKLAARLRSVGFTVTMNEAHARPRRKGARHCIIVGRTS
jgi:spermidine synthase